MAWEERTVPFKHWVRDNLISVPEVVEMGSRVSAHWGSFRSQWVRYDNDLERNKWTQNRVGVVPDCPEMFNRLVTPEFVQELSNLTGVQGLIADPLMHGAGLHIVGPGGWLSPHLDYALHPKMPTMERRVNLILFLTGGMGGAFEMYDDEGREVRGRVEPEPGRVVVWCPGDVEFHGTQMVTGPLPRITACIYYLAPVRFGITRKRALYVPNRGSM